MKNATAALSAERLRHDVQRWLDANNLADVRLYLGDEWALVEERIGVGAPLTIQIRNVDFAQRINRSWDDGEGPFGVDELIKDFADLIRSRGYYFELGYTNTLHLYPLDSDGSGFTILRRAEAK